MEASLRSDETDRSRRHPSRRVPRAGRFVWRSPSARRSALLAGLSVSRHNFQSIAIDIHYSRDAMVAPQFARYGITPVLELSRQDGGFLRKAAAKAGPKCAPLCNPNQHGQLEKMSQAISERYQAPLPPSVHTTGPLPTALLTSLRNNWRFHAHSGTIGLDPAAKHRVRKEFPCLSNSCAPPLCSIL